MAVRSRDFVRIAEGIRSHELSAKNLIENLKGRVSELSSSKRTLESTISCLEAEIAAAYEDTDEDGNPDYTRISALEGEKYRQRMNCGMLKQTWTVPVMNWKIRRMSSLR